MNAQERAARAVLRPRSGQVTVAPIDPPSRTAGEAPGTSTPPGVSPTASDWWTDHDALAELWRWLEDRGQEPNDVAYYLERPWKWTPEYDDMRSEQTALP